VSRDGFEVSSDPGRLDRALIHRFLHDESYWAAGVPRDVVDRALDNSLCFGLYDRDGRQAGFARVVTDRAAIAYLADVFVLNEHRGRGLGKWLIETVMSHPELQGLRRFFLGTVDAHALYERYGFRPLADPDRMMEIAVPYKGHEA
jgi:GNAT superfamily N-acetyltransferase